MNDKNFDRKNNSQIEFGSIKTKKVAILSHILYIGTLFLHYKVMLHLAKRMLLNIQSSYPSTAVTVLLVLIMLTIKFVVLLHHDFLMLFAILLIS